MANKITQHRHALLLGNGFSIAYNPGIFSYTALFKGARFDEVPTVRQAFEAVGTWDFERVIRHLDAAAILAHHYGQHGILTAKELTHDAAFVQSTLVEAISTTHPNHVFEIDEESYNSTATFVRHFREVFTLNYDLLLYWTLMHTEKAFCRDGFSWEGNDLEWSGPPKVTQTIHFLHGGLHLFLEETGAITKIHYQNGQFLIEQIRKRIMSGRAPIFVCEGTSEQKLRQMQENRYLRHCYKRLALAGPILFVYGHSMSQSDSHIADQIVRGNVSHLFISIYGDPATAANQALIAMSDRMRERRELFGRTLDVNFYDAKSADLWKTAPIPLEREERADFNVIDQLNGA